MMLLTENELIGSPAEADAQAISLETFGYVPTYSDVTLTQQDGIKVVKLKLGQILPVINYQKWREIQIGKVSSR